MNRSFYVTVLAIGIYCVAKAVLILLNQWIESSEGRDSFREPAQFVVRVVFGAFGTMIVLENLGISLTAVWTCSVENYVDQYLAQHELRKRIYKRFRDEGIEFPVPQRDVHVSSNPSNEIPFPAFRSKDLLRGSR